MQRCWGFVATRSKNPVLLVTVAAVLGTAPQSAWPAPQEAPPPAEAGTAPEATGQEFYSRARPNLDDPNWIKNFQERYGLKPAESQDDLIPILDKVGAQLAAMLRRIPDLTSREKVVQIRSWPEGMRPTSGSRLMTPVTREYNYLILAHQTGSMVNLEEFRTDVPGKRSEPAENRKDLPLTTNFALLWSRFYPSKRAESRFLYLGEQKLDRHQTFVLCYAQKPGLVTVPVRIQVGGRTYLALDQGLAWIDQTDYHIRQLRIDMLAPRPDLHIRALTTQIKFGEVHMPTLAAPLWLPEQVTVSLLRDDGYFENEHRYSNYQLFTVKSKILPAPPIP